MSVILVCFFSYVRGIIAVSSLRFALHTSCEIVLCAQFDNIYSRAVKVVPFIFFNYLS